MSNPGLDYGKAIFKGQELAARWWSEHGGPTPVDIERIPLHLQIAADELIGYMFGKAGPRDVKRWMDPFWALRIGFALGCAVCQMEAGQAETLAPSDS